MKIYRVHWQTPNKRGNVVVEAATFHELEAAFWKKLGKPLECPIEIYCVLRLTTGKRTDGDDAETVAE